MGNKKDENPKALRIFSNKKPSDEIIDTFSTESSTSELCEMCGRTNLSAEWDCNLGEKEYEEEIFDQKENPERYFFDFNFDMIHWGYYRGKKVVTGCPCNFLSVLEKDWVTDRMKIIKFLTLLFKKRRETVNQEETAFEELLKVSEE